MKKSLSLLVAIAMVFSMFATVVSAADQTAGEYLESIGVIKGNGKDLAEGEDWKRQDVAVIVSRLLGKETAAAATANTHGFSDVRGEFYNGYISWAKNEGLMEGNGDGTFGFDASISNQQFAAVVLRALGVDTTGDNYAKVPELAVAAGILGEDTDWSANAVRGVTYDVIVDALNTKVDGVKLGTKLGLPGFEITELELVSAVAVVKSAVALEFNADVATLKSEDVTVEDADGNAVLVEKVTVNGAKATVALSDTLSSGKTYTVNVAAATTAEGFELVDASVEFKYEATTPATIEFAATTIAIGDGNLKVVVKDADGNDITANYSAEDFNVQTSDASVIDGFDAAGAGDAIVNVKFEVDEDTTIETGNQIITVKSALSASITDVSFAKYDSDTDADDNDVKVSVDEEGVILFTVKDQDDKVVAPVDLKDITVKSLNPNRLAVDSNNVSYKALQEGTATVQISATIKDGVKVTKSVIVTIEAKPALSSISVSESSVKIVKGADLDYAFTVKTLDQYGNKISKDVTFEVTSSKTNVATVSYDTNDLDSGEAVVGLTGGADNGSTSVKVTVKFDGKTYTKTVSVSQVAQNGFGGYVAEVNNSTIEVTPSAPKADKDASKTAQVSVYAKDKNGNKYEDVTGDVYFSSSDSAIATVNASGIVEAVKAGNVTINVKAGATEETAATVASVKITVVNSAPVLTKVTQGKSTITVDDTASNIFAELFGKNKALVPVDQYGDVIDTEDLEFSIASSDSSVVNSSGSVIGEGKATITVAINKQFFVINVNVK